MPPFPLRYPSCISPCPRAITFRRGWVSCAIGPLSSERWQAGINTNTANTINKRNRSDLQIVLKLFDLAPRNRRRMCICGFSMGQVSKSANMPTAKMGVGECVPCQVRSAVADRTWEQARRDANHTLSVSVYIGFRSSGVPCRHVRHHPDIRGGRVRRPLHGHRSPHGPVHPALRLRGSG